MPGTEVVQLAGDAAKDVEIYNDGASLASPTASDIGDSGIRHAFEAHYLTDLLLAPIHAQLHRPRTVLVAWTGHRLLPTQSGSELLDRCAHRELVDRCDVGNEGRVSAGKGRGSHGNNRQDKDDQEAHSANPPSCSVARQPRWHRQRLTIWNPSYAAAPLATRGRCFEPRTRANRRCCGVVGRCDELLEVVK